MPGDAVSILDCGLVEWVKDWTKVCPGIFLTGPIPRQTSYEDTGGAFFLDDSCRIPDMLPDDQALVLESAKGLIVILGCAHAGTVNTLDYISRKTGQRTIYAVIGGMHLNRATQQKLEKTTQALRHYHIQQLVPLHCTGTDAVQHLQTELRDIVLDSTITYLEF